MFKILKKATLAFAAVAMVSASPVALAAPVGSIEGNFYEVRNVTKNGAYGESATADKCETVKYSISIHNPGPDPLTNVKVQATLDTAPSTNHGSQATVSADNANPASRTDTTSVVLPAAYGMSYEAGSTRLLDPNGGVLQNLPDGIIGSGVTLPNGVGVSLGQIRFVQFQAKVNCDTPVCPPGTTGTPPNCDKPKPPVTPPTSTTKTTPPAATVTPSVIPATGPEAAFAGILGSGALGYGIRQWFNSRRSLRDLLQ